MAPRNRGKRKPKLRDLSRILPSREEETLLQKEFLSIRPHVVIAMLGQSFLENQLDTLLRPHFKKNDEQTWIYLTDDMGPLSTFYRKIVTAHAFGICNDVVRDGLHTVRQIRNAFAHTRKPIDFSHDLIRSELRKVTLPAGHRTRLYKNLIMVRELSKIEPETAEDKIAAQASFVLLCLCLENELLKRRSARLKRQQQRHREKYSRGLAQVLGVQPASVIEQLNKLIEER